MQQRPLGRTGLSVSVLGFGCGSVGGLMVRGDPADQARAVARAVDAGISYFDTAAQYGDGASETNLGRVLKTLHRQVLVGTKVRVAAADRHRIAEAIAAGLEASLRRLGRDQVDLFQFHNAIDAGDEPTSLPLHQVLEQAIPELDRLRRAGKVRHIGITAIGATASLRRLVESDVIDTAQIPFNLLNPSAVHPLPFGRPVQDEAGHHFAGHDFAGLMNQAHAAGLGTLAVRVLAGGALSGDAARHPLGSPVVAPIGSGADYAADVATARGLLPLVGEAGADSLVELALRFAISTDALSTALVGISTMEELDAAIRAVEKGPLPDAMLARIGGADPAP